MSKNTASQTDHYAVIGNPIAHSKSPFIHAQFAQQTGEAIQYEAILAPLNQFEMTVKKFQLAGGKGVNVTLPFKYEAYCLAQQHSNAAKSAKAANTLVFHEDGTIFADNTDGAGLIKDLTQNLNIKLAGKRILILGAGGASSGIIAPLLEQQPQYVLIANRTLSKARALVEQFHTLGTLKAYELNNIPDGPYDLIINATSLGLTAEKFSLPGTHHLITTETVCYDLAYGTKPTAFLVWANEQGSNQCYDGLGMLVEQAAAAFYLWRGIYPDTGPVRTALFRYLHA